MADELSAFDEATVAVLPIHFDVPAHYVGLDTFIEAARETEAVIGALNQRLFDGQLSYRIVVAPPKEGSLLAYLGVAVVTVVGGAWAFLQTKAGEEFLRELTGHDLKELSGLAGRKFRERVLKKPPVEKSKEEKTDAAKLEEEAKAADNEQKLTASMIMIETTRTILVADVEKLRMVGLHPQDFTDGFEARNALYRALAADPEIRAVGFDETDKFPIKRKDFARLQVPIEARDEIPAIEHWTVETVNISVSSPNWDRSDSKRQWRGREASGAWRNFQMLDEGFWGRSAKNDLILQGQDKMQVQWAYLGSGSHRKKHKVVKVIAYNGEKLADPLDANALNTIIGSHSTGALDQGDLFGKT